MDCFNTSYLTNVLICDKKYEITTVLIKSMQMPGSVKKMKLFTGNFTWLGDRFQAIDNSFIPI
ncbi:uncharacterized protein PHALS_13587 [Plasmopara halstedii]|uniref:Uncharacterized protein n=1 Tax=Plasmopara halstedii TaxID=4781 RepID=A0A0P1AQP4_PLAHL|nr:uncharacterized protein PHALS_13587 [Plasmopara halstedii]CEG43390.1 hypothetical protein PHALS_13587 [Plasmopara halstedii]|eukprot:XP_024579759.1 hypothetical protein PHALS_13587 [Plasmopara halstedii]